MDYKYLDLDGLQYYNEQIKNFIKEQLESQGKLTFGNYVYDGTEDVTVQIYTGAVEG